MDSTNLNTEVEHTHEHQEPQESQEPQEQIQQDNNVEAEVEIVENHEPVVPEKLHEVEEREQEEETEKGEETVEKIVLEEEVKPEPVKETRKSTSIAAQDQKIILNDVEAEEDQSPTYKDFFDQNKSAKASISKLPEKTESNSASPSKRWDQLYERAKATQEKKDKLRKEFEAVRKEDKECTFKPKLYSSSYNEGAGASSEGDPIHKRTTTWRANKDKKVAEAKEQIKDKDLDGCTFKPDLTKTQGNGFITQNLSPYGTKGVDQHLKRQIVAKQVREEKETILDNPLQKHPAHVYKKEGNITIPNPPEFNKGKSFEINSLKKPFEFPVPRNSAGDSISPKKKVESPQKAIQVLVDPVQVNNVRFGQAIQLLHNELHRIKINN